MRLVRFLLTRVRGTWPILTASLVAGVVSGASSVGLLGLIDHALKNQTVRAGAALAFVALCVMVTISRVGSAYLLEKLSQSMTMDLRLELTRRILAAPLRRLERLGSNRLLATLTHDVNAITQALVSVPTWSINGTIVLGCLGYMAFLDLRLLLLLLVAIAVGTLTYQIPTRLGLRRFGDAREQQDVLYDHFQSLTAGIKELKLHRRRRDGFVGLVTSTSEAMRRTYVSGALIFGSASAWGHLLFFVVIGLLLFANPAFVGARPETLVGYTLVLLYMMAPLQVFLNSVPSLGRASVAVAKVESLGLALGSDAEAAANPSAAGPRIEARSWQSLELEGVLYSYHQENQDRIFAVGPVDLTITPGQVLFVVGGNGSGKTTLAKLLTGLYAPDSGTVSIDGRPVVDLDDQRRLFSVVFNDFCLFDRLLGLEGDLDEEARRYLAELRIDHKVEVRDGKLSTLELSQGQRKRLALLTAYLEDRPIYLFDEWAADQDPIFKNIFYSEILRRLKQRDKAVIVISHDDRYFHLADRIVKLEDGKLHLESPEAMALPASSSVEAHPPTSPRAHTLG